MLYDKNRLGEEQRECKIRSKGFSRKMQKDLGNHSINDPTLLKRKKKCKRLHDEHLARTQEEYRTIPRSLRIRQRKGQQFEGNEEYDYAVDRIAGEPANSFVIVVKLGPNPLEDEQLEF